MIEIVCSVILIVYFLTFIRYKKIFCQIREKLQLVGFDASEKELAPFLCDGLISLPYNLLLTKKQILGKMRQVFSRKNNIEFHAKNKYFSSNEEIDKVWTVLNELVQPTISIEDICNSKFTILGKRLVKDIYETEDSIDQWIETTQTNIEYFRTYIMPAIMLFRLSYVESIINTKVTNKFLAYRIQYKMFGSYIEHPGSIIFQEADFDNSLIERTKSIYLLKMEQGVEFATKYVINDLYEGRKVLHTDSAELEKHIYQSLVLLKVSVEMLLAEYLDFKSS